MTIPAVVGIIAGVYLLARIWLVPEGKTFDTRLWLSFWVALGVGIVLVLIGGASVFVE